MMVARNANSRTDTMGRDATLEQVEFRMDHKGVIENTNAASAICDFVSKARMLDSAKTIELLRNSMRSRREAATGTWSGSTAWAAIGSVDMSMARPAATPCSAAARRR